MGASLLALCELIRALGGKSRCWFRTKQGFGSVAVGSHSKWPTSPRLELCHLGRNPKPLSSSGGGKGDGALRSGNKRSLILKRSPCFLQNVEQAQLGTARSLLETDSAFQVRNPQPALMGQFPPPSAGDISPGQTQMSLRGSRAVELLREQKSCL